MSRTETLYVDVREGPAPAELPGDVVESLRRAAPDDPAFQRGLRTAALIVIRLGDEAGTAMVRHLVGHDPGVVLDADPLFAQALADEPELIVGPLAGTAPCTLS